MAKVNFLNSLKERSLYCSMKFKDLISSDTTGLESILLPGLKYYTSWIYIFLDDIDLALFSQKSKVCREI